MAELWVEESGPADGPVVVFVHGAMDRSAAFSRVARRLRTDLRVVRYDRRGYGRSVALGPPYTFDQQADDVAGVIGGRRAVVVGHSFGGAVAIAAALRHPGAVRGLLLYEPALSWAPFWPERTPGAVAIEVQREAVEMRREDGYGAAAESFMRRMIGNRVWERLPESTRAARRGEGRAMVEEARAARVGPWMDVSAIGAPTVAAYGSESMEHLRLAAMEVARVVPDTPLVRVEGAGHVAHLTHPDEFAAVVRLAVVHAEPGPPS